MAVDVIAFQMHYMRIFQDLAVAMMCSQLHYWYEPDKNGNSKLRIKHLDQFWVAKSHVEWFNECGLTRKQSRRALDVLRGVGVIETLVKKFNRDPVVHIRALRPQGDQPLKKGEYLTDLPLDLSILGLPLAPEGHDHVPKGQSITEITDIEITNSDKPSTLTGANTKQTLKTTPPGEKKAMAKGDSADVLLKQFKDKQKAPLEIGQIVKPSDFWRVWQQAVPRFNEDIKVIGPYTDKLLAQCRHPMKTWGKHTGDVLLLVCQRWIPFIKFAEKHYSAFKSPLSPTIPYLVRYREAALNYWMSQQKSGASPDVQSTATTLTKPKLTMGIKKPLVKVGSTSATAQLGLKKPGTLLPDGDHITTAEDVAAYTPKGKHHGTGSQ